GGVEEETLDRPDWRRGRLAHRLDRDVDHCVFLVERQRPRESGCREHNANHGTSNSPANDGFTANHAHSEEGRSAPAVATASSCIGPETVAGHDVRCATRQAGNNESRGDVEQRRFRERPGWFAGHGSDRPQYRHRFAVDVPYRPNWERRAL